MVLADDMKSHILFSSALFIVVGTASAQAHPNPANNKEKFMIAGHQYYIAQNTSGNCTITNVANKSVTVLELKAGCSVVKSGGKVQTKYLRKYGTSFFIAGPPAPMEEFKNQDWVKPEYRCSKTWQRTFVLKNGTLKQWPLHNVDSICPDIGVDGKDFYIDKYSK
jgi:hypothetical protein